MEENSETKSVNAINHAEDRIQDDDKEQEFNTAGVNFDQKYKPRTAVLRNKIRVFSKELDDSPHSSS